MIVRRRRPGQNRVVGSGDVVVPTVNIRMTRQHRGADRQGRQHVAEPGEQGCGGSLALRLAKMQGTWTFLRYGQVPRLAL